MAVPTVYFVDQSLKANELANELNVTMITSSHILLWLLSKAVTFLYLTVLFIYNFGDDIYFWCLTNLTGKVGFLIFQLLDDLLNGELKKAFSFLKCSIINS